jgi:hypothetical protein
MMYSLDTNSVLNNRLEIVDFKERVLSYLFYIVNSLFKLWQMAHNTVYSLKMNRRAQ